MWTQLRPALLSVMVLTLLTGIVYPLLLAGIASLAFPFQAHGSLVTRNGRIVGSRLIGQEFTSPRYFWSRPSATTPAPYNAAASSGSNLGPTNEKLTQEGRGRIAHLRATDPTNTAPVPIDLITASGSGLDPDISPAAAHYQAGRVARARSLAPARVHALVEQQIEGRVLGFLGEPQVNVLQLNLALDALGSR
ncbi:potassium-transporting ATPase subunit KdpC [Gloeobacter kilaueensis]|uniref:Potassium-transporting ATPase KdpC subunit n=1 Tax=Gloeobacter kilaueensis (strain ATCC BAA-2537 / CCAP 1431/1 / ULC 316 / JS1) TaxID=1183438 RepID=U5QMY5_GLOK1|nr:potassium-transporting ATPase subunit KdpC [Gloeobacter kilaueensis]AGY58959.1 potassium-transporting ATPase subunit C [Gloeobacter kilaueensis JS1]